MKLKDLRKLSRTNVDKATLVIYGEKRLENVDWEDMQNYLDYNVDAFDLTVIPELSGNDNSIIVESKMVVKPKMIIYIYNEE